MTWDTDGFTSPPKEVMLRIFITLENLLSSAVFEPTNIGSNGKHDNNQTTEGDFLGACMRTDREGKAKGIFLQPIVANVPETIVYFCTDICI
jgi:hypothetical protein